MFFLTSTSFEAMTSRDEVRARAVEMIPAIRALARMVGVGDPEKLIAYRVQEQTPDGPKDHVFVDAREALGLALRHPDPTVSVAGQPPPRPKPIPAELALKDPAVKLAVDFYARGTFIDLYNALDVIIEAGADPEAWAAKEELNLFTWTANNVNALGPDSRHGRTDWQAPPIPMTLPEAWDLIGRVLEGWMKALT